ncbi:MAG TPA: Mov34/MPN/PAD-1 family protein [Tepidisphaeraceae bacterium]|jgi:proteasome lid subunit RPN8/RPN11|nr:Mov34/MPN/PAD-1 family protein [Tepidisphaeraceae bacterium]
MGVIQTIEPESTIYGGIDFSKLPRRDLIKLRLSGPRTSEFQVVIRQSALNRLHTHGDSSPRVEICGVLVGDVYNDGTGPFLMVEHIVEGQSSTGSAGQVTFTAATWQHIQTSMDSQFPDHRIVGWYHTHPGHGVFLSKLDVFVHESFFGLPWQTALVYDPRSGEEGVFGAEAGQSKRLGYLIDADEPAAEILSQKAISPSASNAEAEPAATPRPGATPALRTRKRRHAPLGRILLGIIGLALFAAMGLLLGLLIRLQDFHIPEWILHMARS